MNDEAALLAAIIANTGEDTPRLAFADWLEENRGAAGAARARWIRLQVESHRAAPPLPLWYTHPGLLAGRGTGIGPGGPIVPQPFDRLAGVSDAVRTQVADLETELDAQWGRSDPHALMGLTRTNCLIGGRATNEAAHVDQHIDPTDVRRLACREIGVTDMHCGSRRGFFGAVACTPGVWEAAAEALCYLCPVEEVELTGSPLRPLAYYRERWPGIRFNPRVGA